MASVKNTFSFKAKIYKVGINPCVKVPRSFTKNLTTEKGYIYVKGTINKHTFTQTLVPVKNQPYRLYVNAPMLKGGNTNVGQTAEFSIRIDTKPPVKNVPMVKELHDALKKSKLTSAFNALTPSRQKEILKYLHNLKSEESRMKNINRVIRGLAGKEKVSLFRL